MFHLPFMTDIGGVIVIPLVSGTVDHGFDHLVCESRLSNLQVQQSGVRTKTD